MLRTLLRSPAVLLPAVAGGALLGLATLLGDPVSAMGFVGAVGLVTGAGVAAWRLAFRGRDIAEEAARDAIRRRGRERRRELKQLESEMRRVNRPRLPQAVRDLAKVQKRIDKARLSPDVHLLPDLSSDLDDMYASCVRLIRHGGNLARQLREITTNTYRDELEKSLDESLEDVHEGVRQLEHTIDAIRARSLTRGDGDEVSRIGRDLAANLEVARRVEDRMADLDRELAQRRGEAI